MSELNLPNYDIDKERQEPLVLDPQAGAPSVFEKAFEALSQGKHMLAIEGRSDEKNAILGTLGARLVIAGFGKLLRLRGNQKDFLTTLSEQLQLERQLPLEEAILSIPSDERYIVMIESAELLDASAIKILKTMLVASANRKRVRIILYSDKKISIPKDDGFEGFQVIEVNSPQDSLAQTAATSQLKGYRDKMAGLVNRIDKKRTKPHSKRQWSMEHIAWGLGFMMALGLVILTWMTLLGQESLNEGETFSAPSNTPGYLQPFVPEPVLEEPSFSYVKNIEKPYVNQIFGSWNSDKAEAFVAKHHLSHSAKIIATERLNKPWYIVTLGAYEDVEDAELALTKLPEELRQYNPWVRAMKVQ